MTVATGARWARCDSADLSLPRRQVSQVDVGVPDEHGRGRQPHSQLGLDLKPRPAPALCGRPRLPPVRVRATPARTATASARAAVRTLLVIFHGGFAGSFATSNGWPQWSWPRQRCQQRPHVRRCRPAARRGGHGWYTRTTPSSSLLRRQNVKRLMPAPLGPPDETSLHWTLLRRRGRCSWTAHCSTSRASAWRTRSCT